jgi:hypothetical protein
MSFSALKFTLIESWIALLMAEMSITQELAAPPNKETM